MWRGAICAETSYHRPWVIIPVYQRGSQLTVLNFRDGTGKPVDQAIGSVHLVVAADLVELLAGVAQDFAGLAHIGRF